MKFGIKAKSAVVVFGFSLLGGCSSCGEVDTANTNTEVNSNTKVIVPKRVDNPVNSNANANLKPYPGANKGENPTLDNSKITVIDTKKPTASPPARPAPDNSEIRVTMNSKGHVIESRTFLKHKQLAKIERLTIVPNKNVVIKVYLRNGKVIELPDKKIQSFRSSSASVILAAAGVRDETRAAPPTSSDPVSETKQDNQ